MIEKEQFEGALLGLALGDALGAPREGGLAERLLWRLIGTTARGEMRWTDDTQMSIDLAESLLAQGAVDADDLARRFAASYRWSRGYGPGAAKLLKRIAAGRDWRQASRSVYPDGSYGNGGAMRSSVVGLFYARRPEAELLEAARLAASVTHAHPAGMEGAALIAAATALALRGVPPVELLARMEQIAQLEPFAAQARAAAAWLQAGDPPSARQVARTLGNGIAASASCMTAIYIAARFMRQPFADMLAFVARCGGDVDTVGAMAGAVWGAAHALSSLPPDWLAKLEQKDRLIKLADALYLRSQALGGRAIASKL